MSFKHSPILNEKAPFLYFFNSSNILSHELQFVIKLPTHNVCMSGGLIYG